MKRAKTPVMMLFFNRPNSLKKVFEAVKEARPEKLFLVQDGARIGKGDEGLIEQCRKVVSDIDWDCEVYRNYSEENMGCGMRMYSGISWCFESVDRLIILEDDCVPNQSFFQFCDEILEKYKNDERINMISGMNHMGVYENTQYSYMFAKTGSCWGWATWRRAWKNVEYAMPFMEDEEALRLISGAVTPKGYGDYLVKLGKERYKEYKSGNKLSAWTYQHGMSIHLNSQLIIVPTKNLITNVGLTENSTHAVSSLKKLPHATQKLFMMKTYSLEFPLKHPKYMIENVEYAKQVGKILGGNKYGRMIEGYIRRIVFAEKGDYAMLSRKLCKKLRIGTKGK